MRDKRASSDLLSLLREETRTAGSCKLLRLLPPQNLLLLPAASDSVTHQSESSKQ